MLIRKTLEFKITHGVLLMIRELVIPVFQRQPLVSIHVLVIGHHYASYSLPASSQVLAMFWRSGRLMALTQLPWMPESPHLRLQHHYRLPLLINPLHRMLLVLQLNITASQKKTSPRSQVSQLGLAINYI